MRRFIKLNCIIISCLFFTSCYDNETIIIDESEEANLRVNDELTTLMKSVTSHDASFDDFIDGAHCFSINFPYDVVVDDEVIHINSNTDIIELSELDDEIKIVFPISISLTNFEKHNITSNSELEELRQMCADGLFYDDHISCADFIFPLKMAIYDTNSRRFNQLELNSNKEAFLFLNNLDQHSIYQIVYPANIFMFHQEHFSIENNFSLTTHFKIAHNTCGVRD